MDDPQDCLQQAFAYHQAGQLAAAEPLYRTVLQHHPAHVDTLYLLGTLYVQAGRYETAIDMLQQAVTLRPGDASAHHNLGSALHNHGQRAAAQSSYEQALALNPNDAAAHYNLGVTCYALGQYEKALSHFTQALALNPEHVEAHYNLGVLYQERGELEKAAAQYEQTITLNSRHLAAHINLGNTRRTQGQLEKAAASYEQALALNPDDAETYNHLGMVQHEQGQLEAAAASFTRALARQPHFVAAHNNLGLMQRAQGQLDAAVSSYEQALTLDPTYAVAYNNLGNALKDQGCLDAALNSFEQALRVQPDYAEAHWNRALLWLTQGSLAQGWPEYEWRFRTRAQSLPLLAQPRWDGSSLRNRTILVYAEQGVGDEVLFASCLPDLIAQAGHVVIVCDPRLVPLFSRSFPAATIRRSVGRDDTRGWLQLPAFDVHTPIGSLPNYLRHTLDAFSSQAGYLVPDPTALARWTHRLAALGDDLKVGVAWRSRATRRGDPHYTDLAQWDPILTLPGVQFVNLQYDDAATELADIQQRWGLTIHAWSDLDLFHDLDGMAALIAALDLVIAPETVVAQIAGAVGKPVWQLMTWGGSWPMLGTAAQPWFPNTRVFCQPRQGDWPSVVRQIATELTCRLHRDAAL